jgi:hypothetical protein
MFTSIYIPQGTLAKRLEKHKARMAACAYYPSVAVVGERVQGYHTMPREPGGTRFIGIDVDLRVTCATGLRHDGWYCDNDMQHDVFVPVVVRLPHGRLLGGYREPRNDGVCVDLDSIYTCEASASHGADEFTRIAAEQEREYQEEERVRMAEEEKEEEAWNHD